MGSSLSLSQNWKYRFLLISMSDKGMTRLVCSCTASKKETPSLPEASFHCFNFTHCTKQNLRHYRQASSKRSIQKKKGKEKYTYLQKHTACHFSMILCALHLERLTPPTVFISQHCKGGHLVQLLTGTDSQ